MDLRAGKEAEEASTALRNRLLDALSAIMPRAVFRLSESSLTSHSTDKSTIAALASMLERLNGQIQVGRLREVQGSTEDLVAELLLPCWKCG
jgi:predicted transcriptional regulator with HTH domain